MMTPQQQLLELCRQFAAHEGITHWAVSSRILGRGDFFSQLQKPGRDIRVNTFKRVLGKFASIWPDDLEWPSGIPRPKTGKDAA